MYRRKSAKFVSTFLAIAFGFSAAYADPMCGAGEKISSDKNHNWYLHAQSKRGECCCGDYDGIREGTENPKYGTFIESDIKDGHYRVRILPPSPYADEKPAWYDVPDSALVKEQDRNISTPPPVAELWTGGWSWDHGKRLPRFRCLHPGAGM